ncbi:MAG: enoyl-CoA hydratase [Hyphomicrobiaceae bacterium]
MAEGLRKARETIAKVEDNNPEPLVTRERVGPVAVLTLNRPERRNPLSEGMMTALSQSLVAMSAHREIRAIVITAKGPVFSAGHDLNELSQHREDGDRGRKYFERTFRQCSDLMRQINRYPRPVIAAVQGTATAAGCQLVATCDLAVAADSAKFCTPGVNIGLFCSTPMVALSRNILPKRALEMLLLGEMMTALQAAEFGLVNRVVPADRVLAEALAMAKIIADKSPFTVQVGKEAFYAQLETTREEAYSYAAEVMVENMMAQDAEEGIAAFLNKRKPEWKGC